MSIVCKTTSIAWAGSAPYRASHAGHDRVPASRAGPARETDQKAIAGVNAAENFDASMPVGPGALLSGELLFQPRIARPPIPGTADSPRQMTAEQEARMNLHRRARDARTAMPTEVRVYLQGVMGGGRQIRASQLPITGIKQFRMVQTLSTYAQEAMTGLGKKHHEGISKRLPDIASKAPVMNELPGRIWTCRTSTSPR